MKATINLAQFNEKHILVGLGGTGGKILRQFRKRMFMEYPKTEIEKMPLGFIYLDSDATDLDAEWNDIGIDYSISSNGRINIKSMEFDKLKNNVSSFKGIQPWFGEPAEWNVLNLNAPNGASQRRRIGRTYFASHLKEPGDSNYNHILNQIFYECDDKLKKDKTTFHVFSGIAGGTGSGTIIDIIAQISKGYPNSNTLIYLVLPETNNPRNSGKNQAGYYYANAYACLAELNAISLNSFIEKDSLGQTDLFYQPYDISGDYLAGNDRVKAKFGNCYLFQDVNEKGKTYDIDEQVPKIISDFVYQSIFYLNGGTASVAIQKLTENQSDSLERDKYSGKLERSAAFASAGIMRIALPDEEITNFLGNSIVLNALYQIKYNNWKNEIGYDDSKRSDDISKYLKIEGKGSKKEDWKLRLNYLSLDNVIQTSDIALNVKTIEDEWAAVSTGFLNNVVNRLKNGHTKTPLSDLWNSYSNYSDELFRGCGVKKWWNQKEVEKVASAIFDEIIHPDIYKMWLGDRNTIPELSLIQIKELLLDLTGLLDKISDEANEGIRKLTADKFDSKTSKDSIKGCLSEYTALTKVYANIGLLGEFLLGKQGKVITDANTFAYRYYRNLAELEAYGFSKKLIIVLKKRINLLSSAIEDLLKKIDTAIKENEKITSELRKRYFNKEESVKSEQVYVQYIDNSENIKKIYTEFFVKQEDILQKEAYEIRLGMASRIKSEDFVKLNDAVKSEDFKNEFLYRTKFRIPVIQDALIDSQKIDKKSLFVNNNVLRYLKNLNDVDLKNKIKQLHDFSLINCVPELLQSKITEYGINSIFKQIFVLAIPNFPDDPAIPGNMIFRAKFISDIQAEIKGGLTIVESVNENEIVLFKVSKEMPLRTFNHVNKLYKEYKKRKEGTQFEEARLTLHTEGEGSQLPLLTPLNDEEYKIYKSEIFIKEYLPLLILGLGMKIVKKELLPSVGEECYIISASSALDDDLVLGKKLLLCKDEMFINKSLVESLLIKKVDEKLKDKSAYFLRPAKDKLIEFISNDVLNRILSTECGNDKNSSEFEIIRKAAQTVIQKLKA
jgi:hypothetical protein